MSLNTLVSGHDLKSAELGELRATWPVLVLT
jgi:hypothetical protein